MKLKTEVNIYLDCIDFIDNVSQLP